MRIGIFGGTFNPVHLGHTALASYICNLGLVDEVWLMVSPQNPFKRDHQLLDETIRYHLSALAVRDFPRLRASDFEFHLPRPSYTYVTLAELTKAYPDDTFSLIIGGDNWDKFSQWRKADEILAQYPIIVYPRQQANLSSQSPSPTTPNSGNPNPGVQNPAIPPPPDSNPGIPNPEIPYPTDSNPEIPNPITLPSAPLYPISSTAIRTAIAAGDDVSPWLDPAVYDEIRRLNLYRI